MEYQKLLKKTIWPIQTKIIPLIRSTKKDKDSKNSSLKTQIIIFDQPNKKKTFKATSENNHTPHSQFKKGT